MTLFFNPVTTKALSCGTLFQVAVKIISTNTTTNIIPPAINNDAKFSIPYPSIIL